MPSASEHKVHILSEVHDTGSFWSGSPRLGPSWAAQKSVWKGCGVDNYINHTFVDRASFRDQATARGVPPPIRVLELDLEDVNRLCVLSLTPYSAGPTKNWQKMGESCHQKGVGGELARVCKAEEAPPLEKLKHQNKLMPENARARAPAQFHKLYEIKHDRHECTAAKIELGMQLHAV